MQSTKNVSFISSFSFLFFFDIYLENLLLFLAVGELIRMVAQLRTVLAEPDLFMEEVRRFESFTRLYLYLIPFSKAITIRPLLLCMMPKGDEQTQKNKGLKKK